MHIIDRKTFLSLPAGTVFCKFAAQPLDGSYADLTYGNIAIKGETTGVDFVVQDVFPWFEGVDDSNAWTDVLLAMLRGAPSPPLDYDCAGRDGFFDDNQLFAVFDREDHRRLIARLQLAFDEAYQLK